MPSRPNILFVLADQLGARWLPLHGHPVVSTPRLDDPARRSIQAELRARLATRYRQAALSAALASWHERVIKKESYPEESENRWHRVNT